MNVVLLTLFVLLINVGTERIKFSKATEIAATYKFYPASGEIYESVVKVVFQASYFVMELSEVSEVKIGYKPKVAPSHPPWGKSDKQFQDILKLEKRKEAWKSLFFIINIV